MSKIAIYYSLLPFAYMYSGMWDIQLVGVVLELTMGILSVLCSGQCCVCLFCCVVSAAAGKSSLSSAATVLTALDSLRVCWVEVARLLNDLRILVALPLHWSAFIEGLLYCQIALQSVWVIALQWVCIVLCCYSYIKSPSVVSDRLHVTAKGHQVLYGFSTTHY